jgi:imidazolonepropionase-like amidohydrolase
VKCAVLLLAATLAGRAQGQTIAITGGTLYPVSGPKVENGTILLRDGMIAAVGADVAIPAGATRVDAAGRWITPGLIHLRTTLGLKLLETGGEEETQEDLREGEIKASFSVAEGLDPASMTIPVARMEGITSAAAVPSVGLIPGQAALIDLAGTSVDEMLIKAPAAMIADLSQGGKPSGGGSRAGAVLRLERVLRDAREYAERKDDFRRNRIQPLAATAEDLEALQPVLRGELPLFVIANRRSDIESALRIAREFKLRIGIYGGVEAWQVAAPLAAAKVPVILEPLPDLPTFDALGARLDNATMLREAGVSVVAAQSDAAHFRDLRQAAGNQVRNGMSWDDALRTVTLAPAEAALVSDRYGSLDSGKVANIVVWSGDPLELSSRVERVFIRGQPVSLVSRQTELLHRYRRLPPAY